ncbi:hypothetical protein GQ53DRAFT_820436 [Thozetella sp. PMI_491]|nr:hypothetical protein GQ53DRAFT_820436 [Thozetella sp. PMI_491]
MTYYELSPDGFSELGGKVVVLTGSVNGVGECIVRALYAVGAQVVFGDIDEQKCAKLADELALLSKSVGASFIYQRMVVRSYEDNPSLF